MKKILFIGMLLMMFVNLAEAQKQYGFDYRTSSTLTSAVAVSVTPVAALTVYTITADTNITYSAVVTDAVIGDKFVLQITADASARIMAFGTNITAVNDTITATKTRLYEFIYTGTGYYMLGKLQAD
ncbi:MAG: hypothetical protein Q8O72_10600 [Bacteroidales bacterium]|nr:hypothetical protein [Bacteroidales bacterium]